MYKENLPVFRQLDGTYGLERGSKGKTLTLSHVGLQWMHKYEHSKKHMMDLKIDQNTCFKA